MVVNCLLLTFHTQFVTSNHADSFLHTACVRLTADRTAIYYTCSRSRSAQMYRKVTQDHGSCNFSEIEHSRITLRATVQEPSQDERRRYC
jgi:hypothetical protein